MEGILSYRATLKKQGPLEVPLAHNLDADANAIYRKLSKERRYLNSTQNNTIFHLPCVPNNQYFFTYFFRHYLSRAGNTLITQLSRNMYTT